MPGHGAAKPPPGGVSLKNSWLAISALQICSIVFTSATAGIVSTSLDDQEASPYCYLNVKGDVCVFTYVTAGAVILFSLSIALPLVIVAARRRWAAPPVLGVYLSIALFSWAWQIVMCITITIRGNQASDAGLPGSGARTSAIACAWVSCACTSLTCLLIIADLLHQRRPGEPLLPTTDSASEDSAPSSDDPAFAKTM